jgi:hypothetical protein
MNEWMDERMNHPMLWWVSGLVGSSLKGLPWWASKGAKDGHCLPWPFPAAVPCTPKSRGCGDNRTRHCKT